MGWIKKEKPTPFDEIPLSGLFFLDGDILARLWGRDWTAGEKFPMIAFPSGEEFQIWESSNPERGGIIHIFQLHGVVKQKSSIQRIYSCC